jgi:membrane protein implicated in regulation of membrane protease activity
MTWWSWMILGLVLLGAELFAIDAQFFLVFLGVSAALVGLADLVGINMPEWVQWTVFAVLALISMVTFRKNLYDRIRGGAPGFRDSNVGDMIQITNDLEPGSDTRTEYRGTDWTIRNVGPETLQSGTTAKIVKVEGLRLHVSKE